MRPSLNLSTAAAATICLFASPISASPLERRAAATVYTWESATTVSLPASVTAAADVSCPDSIVSATSDCPSGCTAAPAAGMIGVATDYWSCMAAPAPTSWTSVMATSTCDQGAVVTTYTLYGGQLQEGCTSESS